MPCDLIQRQSISFKNAVGHEELLAEALRTLGYHVTVRGQNIYFEKEGVSGTYRYGNFEHDADQLLDVDAIKVEFSKNVVRKSAKQYGWSVEDLPNNKMRVKKRRM